MTLPENCEWRYFVRHIDAYHLYRRTGVQPVNWVTDNCRGGAIVRDQLGVTFCFSDPADALAFRLRFVL